MDPRNRAGEVAQLLQVNLGDLKQIACGIFIANLIEERTDYQVGRRYPAFYIEDGVEKPVTSFDMFVERIGIDGVMLSNMRTKHQETLVVTPVRVVPKNLYIEVFSGDQRFTRQADKEAAAMFGIGIFRPWFQMTYACDGILDLVINNFGLTKVIN